MQKRALSLLFAMLLLLSLVLAGCSSKAPSEEPIASTGTEQPVDTAPSDGTQTPPDTSVTPEQPVQTPTVPTQVTTAPVQSNPSPTAPAKAPAKAATPEKAAAPVKASPPAKTPAKTTTPVKTTTPAKATAPTPAPAETTVPAETTTEETEPTAAPAHEPAWATDSPMFTVDSKKVKSIETDKGLFTIRYFLLDADHKSGDSILLHTPDDKYILIDSGVVESGDQLVKYLKDLGVTKLDAVFNTHPHGDHLGGMVKVVNNFPITDYYKNYRVHTSSTYTKTMAALNGHRVPVHVLSEGDDLDFGGGVTVHVYNPPKDMDPYQYAADGVFTDSSLTVQLNQESLALMFTYKDVKMFFCGDLYQMGETDMVNRYPAGTFTSDIVHAPHHGAGTSSSIDYILATDPKLVIMSTNGLQNFDVYQKYTGYGSLVVANSVNGNVLITNDGTKESIHAYGEYQLDPNTVHPVVEAS